jgi:hypothetical protein
VVDSVSGVANIPRVIQQVFTAPMTTSLAIGGLHTAQHAQVQPRADTMLQRGVVSMVIRVLTVTMTRLVDTLTDDV